MPKLLCLVCLTEQSVPRIGSGPGVPSDDGAELICANHCEPEIHSSFEMPQHCGKRMHYFAEDDVDEFRVCPD